MCEFSGSTCVACIFIGNYNILGNHLFTANLGDSRAVLYKKS
jgi:serine/threonine protein phosphatase PrpC